MIQGVRECLFMTKKNTLETKVAQCAFWLVAIQPKDLRYTHVCC
jgi:hypothetical protein